MINEAKKLFSHGLSIIPIGENKIPIGEWRNNIDTLIEPNFSSCKGLGLVCGNVSGNVEVIDIDCKYDVSGTLFKDFKQLISDNDKELLKKLVVQKTVNGGYHFIYKCKEIQGNTKLASRETTSEEKAKNPKEKVKVLLETRGNGGYIAIVPTDGYEMIYGSLYNIQEITTEERELLFICAKSFNQVFKPTYEKKEVKEIISSNISPFEAWNESGDVLSILTHNGWTITNEKGSKVYLLRPAGTGKWSAEYHQDKRLFYVWTSSSEFENDKAYNPSQVLTILNFNGDYSESAKWLLRNGYGETNNPIQSLPIKKEVVNIDLALSTKTEERNWIDLAIQDKIPKGFGIGSEHFDNHFRYKSQTMVGIFGVDNVGKTTFQLFLAVCYAKKHQINWLFICKENKPQALRQKIMELYHGKPLHKQSSQEIDVALKFSYDYFDIISDNYSVNMENIFEVLDKLFDKKHYKGVFIDPYNSIQYDQTPNKNYSFLDSIRSYQNKLDTSFYISMHISTEKARNYVYSDKETIFDFQGNEVAVKGQFKIPRKNFVEGGQPIANKLDDIIIVHRIQKMQELRNYTLVSIDKVKEEQTGGMVSYEEPIMFYKEFGFDSFRDKNGVNPLGIISNSNNELSPLPINTDFDNEFSDFLNEPTF